MRELVRDLPRALLRGLIVALAVGLSSAALQGVSLLLYGSRAPAPLLMHFLAGALVSALVILMSLGEGFVDRRPTIHGVVAA